MASITNVQYNISENVIVFSGMEQRYLYGFNIGGRKINDAIKESEVKNNIG